MLPIPCSANFYENRTRKPAILTVDLNRNVWRCDRINGPCTTIGRCFLYGEKILWFGPRDYKGDVTTPEVIYISTYDLVMKEWSSYPLVGSPLSYLQGFSGDFVAHLNGFVVFGGEKSGNRTNDVDILDLGRKTWIRPVVKGTPPIGRSWHGTCALNRVCICMEELAIVLCACLMESFCSIWQCPMFSLGASLRHSLKLPHSS